MKRLNENDITPVQQVGKLLLKRDDLYTLFESNGVNGGKLRQCVMLIDKVNPSGCVTYCSIGSPQAPITAAVAKSRGIPCIIVYGGTSRERLLQAEMPRLAMHYGARIVIGAKTGRHNVLHAVAERIARQKGYFLVQYGINLEAHGDVLLQAVAMQTQNIPDCEHLIAVCGSGITASGILIGLHMNRINVENVHLVATAPDRRELIKQLTGRYGAFRDFEYNDLFHMKGFNYDTPAHEWINGVTLHPNYEAKAYQWYKRSGIDECAFWITGAKPGLKPVIFSRGNTKR